MIDSDELYSKYKLLVSNKKKYQREIRLKTISLKKLSRRIKDYNDALSLLTNYTKAVQKNIKEFIEFVVTTSVQIVFQEDSKFKLIYEEKRGVPTYKPVIVEGENVYDPEYDKGGCMMDTIGISSRFALWAIRKIRSRNIFFLDEPFRFSGEFAPRVANYLKVLGRKLKFQILISTHNANENGIIDICDRVWKITRSEKTKISKLRRVK